MDRCLVRDDTTNDFLQFFTKRLQLDMAGGPVNKFSANELVWSAAMKPNAVETAKGDL